MFLAAWRLRDSSLMQRRALETLQTVAAFGLSKIICVGSGVPSNPWVPHLVLHSPWKGGAPVPGAKPLRELCRPFQPARILAGCSRCQGQRARPTGGALGLEGPYSPPLWEDWLVRSSLQPVSLEQGDRVSSWLLLTLFL